ncbi:uncharacterized protein LOC112553206 [Pomacea canaliculata]|uniref:uncharacterized protein LOC112553206 n=1 Tax=Pomacea canaliculata TaxID=400727 RepID=UPI000D725F58|nr:uncharacterized protein LOC112553206 [Pomacea canaliculata]
MPRQDFQSFLRWKENVKKENETRKRFEKYHNIDTLRGVTPEELEEAQCYYGKRRLPPPTVLRPYDMVLHLPPDYDPKYKREIHKVCETAGYNARLEDAQRVSSILVNEEYGHRFSKRVDPLNLKYCRRHVMKYVYGTSGVSLGPFRK